MNTHVLWSRILVIVGSVAMLIGAIDPLEGSLIILAGSGLVTLGTFLGKSQTRIRRYWLWVFILIAVGIGIMWGLSAIGGLGGSTGRSLWWALIILPYPVGWLMGIISLIARLIAFLRSRKQMV
jgi:purine-cytosine permease-like protein